MPRTRPESPALVSSTTVNGEEAVLGNVNVPFQRVFEYGEAGWQRGRLIVAHERFSRGLRAQPGMFKRTLKRMLDLVGSTAGLVVLSPIMVVLAVVVKWGSRGPVFYHQQRVGRGGRVFTIYKYRSMVIDAETNGPMWSAGPADRRITREGAFLRKTHLDELPQLWNVLKGDMSLVGPRPERPCFTKKLRHRISGYDQRSTVKPGITGLAQVCYRYDASIADVKRKLRFDRLYIKQMCLTLDLRILMWTIPTVVLRRGQ